MYGAAAFLGGVIFAFAVCSGALLWADRQTRIARRENAARERTAEADLEHDRMSRRAA
jgi:hypothetical protein